MNRPDTRAQMAAQATEILVTTPEEFRRMVQETITHNVKLVRALGLTAD
jgi:tripartite-type tricarboxylate transporter receptor subunit TctC